MMIVICTGDNILHCMILLLIEFFMFRTLILYGSAYQICAYHINAPFSACAYNKKLSFEKKYKNSCAPII